MSNITDRVLSLGVGSLFFDVVVKDISALQHSLTYILVVSIMVLILFYWREGVRWKATIVCLLLYIPTFFLL